MAVAGYVTDSKARTPVRTPVSAVTSGAVTVSGANYVIPVNASTGFAVNQWVFVTDGTNSILGIVSATATGTVSVTTATSTVTGAATSVAVGKILSQVGVVAGPVNLNQVVNYSLSIDGKSIIFKTADGQIVWVFATTAVASTALGLLNTNVGAVALE